MSDQKQVQVRGLKKLRAVTGAEPTHERDNCGCRRYSPCKCKWRANNAVRGAAKPRTLDGLARPSGVSE